MALERAELAALEAALASDGRGGASALEAATALLAARRLSLEDPRLEAIVRRGSERARSQFFLFASLSRAQWPVWMEVVLLDLMGSADREISDRAASHLSVAVNRGVSAQVALRAAVERYPSFPERPRFLHQLGLPSEAQQYWLADGKLGDLEAWAAAATHNLKYRR